MFLDCSRDTEIFRDILRPSEVIILTTLQLFFVINSFKLSDISNRDEGLVHAQFLDCKYSTLQNI